MPGTNNSAGRIRARWSSNDPADEFVVHNPATGRPIATVMGSGREQVDKAVRAAHTAQPAWQARTSRERGRLLGQVATVIRAHLEELAAIESSDNGKPLGQARFDIEAAIAIFELFSALSEAMPSAVRDVGSILDITMLEPYGVVGAIIPFNWPPILTAGKLAPALVVGNAVVLKPPEQAPLSVLRMIELIESVLPADIVHLVPGGGAVGALLAGHPLVDKVSFTGAPATGVAVIKTAAENLTPTLMELGGKNPFLIFPDANLDSALRWALEAGFYNQGEACSAASRVLVHSSIYDEVARRYAAAVVRLRVGDGADAVTDVGPMVTAGHRKRVLDYIEVGVREGATVAAQAPLPDAPELADGYYVPPTLFTKVNRGMRIAREEIFGPVVCLIPFDDEQEAISIANDTDFGLLAAVFTADAERQLRVSRAISAGIVFINHYSRVGFLGTPYGGTKHSGFGRLHAQETLREFGYSKSLRLPSGVGQIPGLPFASEAFK
jgi:acyl-CoA reductase-like NAD-dependent aldehyde dehydrogenase